MSGLQGRLPRLPDASVVVMSDLHHCPASFAVEPLTDLAKPPDSVTHPHGACWFVVVHAAAPYGPDLDLGVQERVHHPVASGRSSGFAPAGPCEVRDELRALWAGKAAPLLVGCHARHRERVLCRAAPGQLAQLVRRSVELHRGPFAFREPSRVCPHVRVPADAEHASPDPQRLVARQEPFHACDSLGSCPEQDHAVVGSRALVEPKDR
jgi:hypothetical protein